MSDRSDLIMLVLFLVGIPLALYLWVPLVEPVWCDDDPASVGVVARCLPEVVHGR